MTLGVQQAPQLEMVFEVRANLDSGQVHRETYEDLMAIIGAELVDLGSDYAGQSRKTWELRGERFMLPAGKWISRAVTTRMRRGLRRLGFVFPERL